MADVYERADSVRLYLTGAVSDGAAQSDPDAALGGFRSSTQIGELGAIVKQPIAPVVVEFVSASNDTGTCTIRGDGDDYLYFTAPDGSEGAGVLIADGETKILEDDSQSKYVRVSRDGTDGLTGYMQVVTVDQLNNLFGMDNVTSAERAAGLDTYRAAMLYVVGYGGIFDWTLWIATLGTQRTSDAAQLGGSGSGTIQTTGSLADWPTSGWCHIKNGAATREIVWYSERTGTTLTVPAGGRGRLGTSAAAGAVGDTIDAVPGIRIGLETPVSGEIQTIANETTAPSGISWDTGITSATGLAVQSYSTDYVLYGTKVGLWIHRENPASGVVSASVENAIRFQFDAP